jgi:sulfatase maturation enzyme AslB (radical SAM superfamily)
MTKWVEEVFVPHSGGTKRENRAKQFLFLDNVSLHKTDEVENKMKEWNIYRILFPANTTPSTQPLDSAVNSSIKRFYSKTWKKWYIIEGGPEKLKKLEEIAQGRKPKDKPRTALHRMNIFIARAINSVSSDLIISCWDHCLMGENVRSTAHETIMKAAHETAKIAYPKVIAQLKEWVKEKKRWIPPSIESD